MCFIPFLVYTFSYINIFLNTLFIKTLTANSARHQQELISIVLFASRKGLQAVLYFGYIIKYKLNINI